MLLNSSPRTPFVQPNHPNNAAIPPVKPPEPPSVPFARFPHSLAADVRLSPTDRLVACALLFWACDRSTADMANRALATYVGVSLATIERAIKSLVEFGYIATRAVKPTVANMTGRVVTLLWVENPTVLPAPPSRSGRTDRERGSLTTEGASTTEGPAPLRDPLPHQRRGGTRTTEGPPPSPVRDKEDRFVKKPKNPENVRTEGEVRERQRPQADDDAFPNVAVDRHPEPSLGDRTQPEPLMLAETMLDHLPSAVPSKPIESAPLAATLDRAMIDVRQAASMADEPINADPGDLLTDGQRQALEVMTEAERAAFERKSPGMRADILRPFERGFEPRIFARMTRAQLVVPRFVADQRPVDRTTPGLVAAVAGGDPRLVIELAELLCRDLGGAGDRRRWGALHSLAKQVLDRVVSAEDLLDAYGQAMGPKAKNRGAVFTTALKRTGWRPGSLAMKGIS